MNPPSIDGIRQIAKSWVAARGKHSEAWEQLDSLIRGYPNRALGAIEEIHFLLTNAEPRDMEAWSLRAAGPLEDLLAEQGGEVIDGVEALARHDPEFRKLLSGVWQNAMTDELFARV